MWWICKDRWLRRPVPAVKAKSYELLQIFAVKYELAQGHETVHSSSWCQPRLPFQCLQDAPASLHVAGGSLTQLH